MMPVTKARITRLVPSPSLTTARETSPWITSPMIPKRDMSGFRIRKRAPEQVETRRSFLSCTDAEQVARNVGVEIDRIAQLFLLDVLAVGVGNVNRARTDQHRLAPACERGNIGSESGDHGFDARHGTEFHERNLQDEIGFCFAGYSRCDLAAQFFSWPDQANQQVRTRMIGDYVGRAAPFDEADVQRRGPGGGIHRQFEFANVLQGIEKLVNRRLAELGIGGVRHLALGNDFDAQGALRAKGDSVLGGFAVDEELRSARIEVGSLRALAVAFFADEK